MSRTIALGLALLLTATPAHAVSRPVEICQQLLSYPHRALASWWQRIFRRAATPPQSAADETMPADEAIHLPEISVHNKDTDTPPGVGPSVAVVTFNQPQVRYFTNGFYFNVDAATARLSNHETTLRPLERRTVDRGAPHLTVAVDHLRDAAGFLHIPFGFTAVAFEGAGASLRTSDLGTLYARTGAGGVLVELKPDEHFPMGTLQRDRLTKVIGAPGLDEYPDDLAHEVRRLKAQYEMGRINDVDLARALGEFIRRTFIYEVDADGTQGLINLCRGRRIQCDGAALILVTLLRSQFDIPCFVVGGALGKRSVDAMDVSVITTGSQPHAFVAVYDPATRRLVVEDPTPDVASRERKNESRDSAFRDISPSGNDAAVAKSPAAPENLWRDVFAKQAGPAWLDVVQQISRTPGADARAAKQIVSLAAPLDRKSLGEHLGTLAQAPRTDAEAKRAWITLRLLRALSGFGKRHSDHPEVFDRIEFAIGRLRLDDSRGLLDREEELRRQLPGALSRQLFDPNHLLTFLQLREMDRRIKLHDLGEYELVPSTRVRTSPTPADSDSDFETAEDFEGFEHFERGGLPPEYDAVRVINDDMIRRVWREEIPWSRARVRRPRGRREGRAATIIIFDRSGSMKDDRRGLFRDRLIQHWIDQAPTEKSILLGYATDAEDRRKKVDAPIYIDSVDAARRLFVELLPQSERFESKGGTDTAAAFRRAIELATELGPRYSQVNFKLVTDGDDGFGIDELRRAKDQVGPDVELNVTAITLGVSNHKLEQFVRESARAGLVGESIFRSLTAEDIDSVLDAPEGWAEWRMGSHLPEDYARLKTAPAYVFGEFARLAELLR